MQIMGIIISSIIDLILAAILVFIFNFPQKILAFFVIIGALWLLPLLLMMWDFLKFWMAYHLYLKTRMVRYFLAEMNKAQFPASASFYDSQAYLNDVANDETAHKQAQIKAAVMLGEFGYCKGTKPLTMFLALQFALERAISEYSPQHPTAIETEH